VQLFKFPDVGVPNAGVTNVADVEPTKLPVPVAPDNPRSIAFIVAMFKIP
jgi:hypothetical protein